MSRLEFRPFKQIPHDLDYEGLINPNSIKPNDSRLLSEAERKIVSNPELLKAVENGTKLLEAEATPGVRSIWLMGRYLNAKLSGERRAAFLSVYDFCSRDYPFNYQTFIDELSATDQGPLGELRDKLEFEFRPPSNFKVRFIFQDHGNYSSQELASKREELERDFETTFKEGESNYYFIEEASDIIKNPMFRRGIELYGTPYRAYPYIAARGRLGREPTPEEVSRFQLVADRVIRENAHDYFGVVTMGVLEKYYDRYKIKVMIEDSGVIHQERTANSTFKKWKQEMIDMDKTATRRNKLIVKQLEGIERECETKGKQANVVVLLGTNHEKLLKDLPLRLAHVSSSITRDKLSGDPAHDELASRLRQDLPIGDSLWEQAYKELYE